MYTEQIEESPAFAPTALSDITVDEMAEFQAEAARCEVAITDEDLQLMFEQDQAHQSVRITPVPLGYRAEVRYPGCTDWSYVGVYQNEGLAIERANDQLRTWDEMQSLPMISPEQHRREILATVQTMRGDVRAEIERIKRTA